ncbi:putative BPI/LBP family protein, partial [Cucurbita argyrosperma subsp. argyrosperma]
MLISQKGLNFIKDFLIDKAVSTIIPLRLPDIEKTVNIALIGKVHIVLSDIIIGSVEVESSHIRIGDTGVNIVAAKATANMSMKWQYTYNTWLFEISDEGDASVQVIQLLCNAICFIDAEKYEHSRMHVLPSDLDVFEILKPHIETFVCYDLCGLLELALRTLLDL